MRFRALSQEKRKLFGKWELRLTFTRTGIPDAGRDRRIKTVGR
jgi:hypothetical protein